MYAQSSTTDTHSQTNIKPASIITEAWRKAERAQYTEVYWFIFEFFTFGEVATLSHELCNDSVEAGSLEVELFLTDFRFTLLTSAEGSEVLCSNGHNVWEQLKDQSEVGLASNWNIEEDLGSTGSGHNWKFFFYLY